MGVKSVFLAVCASAVLTSFNNAPAPKAAVAKPNLDVLTGPDPDTLPMGTVKPVERDLLLTNNDGLLRIQSQLTEPPILENNGRDCLIRLREDTPAFHSLILANLYNHMVDRKLPGYEDKKPVPALNDDDTTELFRRMNMREHYCRTFIPAAAPNIEISYNQQDQRASWTRREIVTALDQLGHSMRLRYEENWKSTSGNNPPGVPLCRSALRTMFVFDSVFNRMAEGTEKENFDLGYSTFHRGFARLCPSLTGDN